MTIPMQHIVLFRFPRELSRDEETEFFAQVTAWPTNIDVAFLRLRVGKDVSGRSRGYQYALLSEFASEEDMKAYQAHPVHQAFGKWVYERDCEVLAFDYELDAETIVTGD